MNNFFKKIIIIGFILAFGREALAAQISFRAEEGDFPPAGEFLVEIYLDTEGESINAIEGTVIFPEDILVLKEIRDGNSAINFWVEEPGLSKDGEIRFSGITTLGMTGASKFMFGMVFSADKIDGGSLDFKDVKALKNDGSGSPAGLRAVGLPFSVSSDGRPGQLSDLSLGDTEAPESFQPFVGRDAEIFGGRYFAVFSTVDKGSGMDKYEVREGRWGEYKEGESPYLLEDQSFGSDIFVKAYDKAGNERVVKIPAPNGNWMLEIGAIVVIILAFVALRKKIWRKSARQ